MSDEAAEAWVNKFLARNGLKPEELTSGDWLAIAHKVPCTIRCWRIGSPVDVKPGNKCPECGKLHPVPTRYERLTR